MITLSSTQDNAAYQAPFYQNFRPLQLVEGGYKGLVVAISPQIPEDDQLVQSIKTVLTDFSSYLYNITNERIYLREVRILIPSTWDDKVRYVTAVSERFEESDLRIDVTPEEENLQIRNLPFTNKPTFCGSQGFYIHLTPDYLKNQTISSLYGSYNKVLAHEWAHYRWGVFDEYPRRDGPHFYLSSTGLIEGVRCTTSITGRRSTLGGSSCNDLPSGFLEDACRFIDDRKNGTKYASLMYRQFLDQVSAYCDEDDGVIDRLRHNAEAPNMHNIQCASKSVWQVMREHSDFSLTETSVVSNPTEFVEVRQRQGRYVLVIDTSASMTYRLRVLRQACYVFIHQVLLDGDSLAIVEFNNNAVTLQELTVVESDNRQQFVLNLPFRASGSTSIGSGVLEALMVLNRTGELDDMAGRIIVMTDGKETLAPSISDIIDMTDNVLIHTIAIGDDVAEDLESLAVRTGGRQFLHQDESTALFDIFSQFGLDSQEVNLEDLVSRYLPNVSPGRIVNIEFATDRTLRGGITTYVAVIASLSNTTFCGQGCLDIELISPSGVIKNANFDSVVSIFTIATTSLEEGTWNLNMTSWDRVNLNLSVLILAEVEEGPASLPITSTGTWAVLDLNPPQVQTVYLTLASGYSPVIEADVNAVVQSPMGDVTMKLYDDGIGEDINKGDGVYSGFFTHFTTPGRYSVQFSVSGNGQVVLGARVGVGAAVDSAKASSEWDLQYEQAGNIQRTITGGSFKCNNEITCRARNNYGPYRVVDLLAQNIDRDSRTFDLVFSAPGADLMEGTAEYYEIRYSTHFKEFRENFKSGLLTESSENVLRPYILRGNLRTPSIARNTERFTIVLPENTGFSIFFFALTANDGQFESPPSNIISISLRNHSADDLPTRDSTTVQNPVNSTVDPVNPLTTPEFPIDNPGNLIIILVVCLSVFILVLISLLAMSCLYIHRLKTNPGESRTDVAVRFTSQSDKDVSSQESAITNENCAVKFKSSSYAYAYDHIGGKEDQTKEAIGITRKHTYEEVHHNGEHYERKFHSPATYYLEVE
ncbi:Calcium-activated chloride channel regulator 4A [Holothuria leucospilota]|uniref:Calcium-activated chloride channel regulator 4A n=1 Tax=Holothuria leucospilota TaxID=206669 RepID=A0A9Q1BRL1_HOLLE|nr:Calcium-activated chloride channel regulator 4A [Holothuria leucospilota]